MSENKDKEQQAKLLKAILSIFLPRSEELQNLFTSIDILIKSFSKSHWAKEVDWQKVIENFNREIKILDDINKQLKERNIAPYLIYSLNMKQSIKLYVRSYNAGITFADMVEDNLKLCGYFNYSNALKYLDIIDKRHKQIHDNKLNPIVLEDNLLEKVSNCEDNISYFVKLALNAYENGTIILNDKEKALLRQLKKNSCLSNKQLANNLGYEVRNIEKICSEIRYKFNLDITENNLTKRHLLLSLATNLKID